MTYLLRLSKLIYGGQQTYRITEEGTVELRRVLKEEPVPEGWIKGFPAKTRGFQYNISKGEVISELFNQPNLPKGWYLTHEEALKNRPDK